MLNGQILPEAITFTDPFACGVLRSVEWAARNVQDTLYGMLASPDLALSGAVLP